MKRLGSEKVRATLPRRDSPEAAPPPRISPLALQPLIGNRAVSALLQSAGRPLDDATNSAMKARFGEDFSSVRLHSNPTAASAAESVNAEAFTVGEDVVFNQGRLSPDEREGKRLLAHELAHVVQQRRGGPAMAGDARLERSAAEAAGAIVDRDGPATVEGASTPGLARQEKAALPEGPAIVMNPSGDSTTLSVAGVDVLTYTQAPDLKIGVLWRGDEPGIVRVVIVRRPTTPVTLNKDAFQQLLGQKYNLVVNEQLLPSRPGEFSELPIVLAPPAAPPPRKPKPPSPPAKAPAKKKEKPPQPPAPALPPLPAPEKAELPPLPPVTTADLPPQAVAPQPPVIAADVSPKTEEQAPPEVTPPVRTPEQLIDDHTAWWGNLEEENLGADLLKRALRGDPAFVQRVIDTLWTTDRDDVSVAFAEAATDDELRKLAATPEGRRLLDQLFDELTAGEVGEDEQKQADRILAIKTRAVIPEEQFAKGLEYAKSHIVLPYKKPGLTVLTASPIYARRLADGKISVHLRVDIYGTDYYYDRDIHLPDRIWDEVILNETDVVGVKFYDEGGVISFFPALYLLQLENESTRVALEKAGEAAFIGLTLGAGGAGAAGGEAAAGGAEAGTLARIGAAARPVLVWADRVAMTLDIVNSVIQEHRGWIIETWPDDGRAFVTGLDQITAYVRIYGLARGAVGMVQLGNALRKSYKNWRAAVKAAQLTEEELQAVEEIGRDTEKLLDSIDDAGRAQPPGAAAAAPPAAAPPATPAPPPPVPAAAESPISAVHEGGGATTPRKTGHLRVAGSKGVVEEVPSVVAAPEEAIEDVEAELKAVSGSKERFAQPKATRRIVQPKTTVVEEPVPAGAVETETAAPKEPGGGGGGKGGGGTGTGVEKQEIKKYVLEKMKEELQGIKQDPTEFVAVHEPVTVGKRRVGGSNTFEDLADKLEKSSKRRVKAKKPALPLEASKVTALLDEGEMKFIRRHPDLDKLYTQLEDLTHGKPVPELENLALSSDRIAQIKDELEAMQVRKIGGLKTDITEVWFDKKRVEIADITLRLNDPLHEMKTLLYKRVMEEMLPGFGVRAQDIKPTGNSYWQYLFKVVGE